MTEILINFYVFFNSDVIVAHLIVYGDIFMVMSISNGKKKDLHNQGKYNFYNMNIFIILIY